MKYLINILSIKIYHFLVKDLYKANKTINEKIVNHGHDDLAQVKASNTSEKILNEIHQMMYFFL